MKRFFWISILFSCLCFMAGCGGGGGNSTSTNLSGSPSTVTGTITSGSPIKDVTISFYRAGHVGVADDLIASTAMTPNASFQVSLTSGTYDIKIDGTKAITGFGNTYYLNDSVTHLGIRVDAPTTDLGALVF